MIGLFSRAGAAAMMGRRRASGGGIAPGTPLLAWDDGAYARALEASRRTAADALAFEIADARRVDGGAFGEPLTLVERQVQSLMVRTDHSAGWSDASAVTTTGQADPAGGTSAFSVAFTASVNARSQLTLTAADFPDGTLATLSVWAKTTSGTATFRLNYVSKSGADLMSSDFTATTTWQRFEWRAQDIGTGVSNPIWRSRNGSGGAVATVVFAFPQIEAANYETSAIRAVTSSKVTRQADQATWLAAEVPLALREGAATMRAAAWWSDADLAASAERWLLSFGGADDGLRVRNDAGAVKLEAVASGIVVASKTLSGLTRRAPADVAWDPVAGTVSYGGVAGSAGTPWTWPATSLRVGGIEGGASEWDGGVALPEAA